MNNSGNNNNKIIDNNTDVVIQDQFLKMFSMLSHGNLQSDCNI